MTAIARRSIRAQIPAGFVAAAADDLDGLPVSTAAEIALASLDVTGAQRVLIVQSNDGTAGTAGIDEISVSHDGGTTWSADPTLLLASANDLTGSIASGSLNAAGVEPVNSTVWKSGPYEGPTLIRCCRVTADAQSAGVTWVTGAPSVTFYPVF